MDGVTIIKPRTFNVGKEARPDGFDRNQHYEKTVRDFYSHREQRTGTDFNEQFCRDFRNMVIDSHRRKPLPRTDHPHPNDADQRRKVERQFADLLEGAQNKFPEHDIVSQCAEYQSSNRTFRTTYRGKVGNFYRTNYCEKDIKYDHVNTKELEDMLAILMTDVDANIGVEDFEDLIYRNPHASILMSTVKPMDATFNIGAHSETAAHFAPTGSYHQATNPAEYIHTRDGNALYTWDRDMITVETTLQAGRYTKKIIQLLSVTTRQVDNRRAYVLLTPVGRRHLYTKVRRGVLHAIIDPTIVERLEKQSSSVDGVRNWRKLGRNETNYSLARRFSLYIKRRSHGARAAIGEVQHLAKQLSPVNCARSNRAPRYVPIDPYKVMCNGHGCGKIEKWNPVRTFTAENGQSYSFTIFRCISTGATDNGKQNTHHDYVAVGTGPGDAYRVPMHTWTRLSVLRNSTFGGWNGRAQIVKILKHGKVYPDESDPNSVRKFEGLADLMLLLFKVQREPMSYENLMRLSFFNETCGRVQAIGDDVIKEPTVVITTRGSLDNRRVSTQPTQASMAHAHHLRQEKPQQDNARAEPQLISKFRKLAHEWANTHKAEHGELKLVTIEEALDGIPASKRPDYAASLEDSLEQVLADLEGGKNNSTFLKPESNQFGKPGRVITTIRHRLQLEMKRCVTAVYGSISGLDWYGMSKPTEIASRMVSAFETMEYGFEGDGSKFDARYGQWTHEIFMEVIEILFGDNWDSIQRRIFMAVVHAPCEYRSKEDGESHHGHFDPNWVMPSGVVWTTIINTLTNFFILATSLDEAGYEKPFDYIKAHCRVGGDDQVGAAKTLEAACHIGSTLQRTADGLGFDWVTNIWRHSESADSPQRVEALWSKYPGLGELTLDLHFLSRLWNEACFGELNSVADPARLFAKISEKEASKIGGITDATRAVAFVEKVISFYPNDYHSFDDFRALIDKCFEALKIPNKKRMQAGIDACYKQSGGAQYYITQDEKGYPNYTTDWGNDAYKRALEDASLDPDILQAVRVTLDRPTTLPVLLDGDLDLDIRITAGGKQVEVANLQPPPRETGEKTKQRASKPRQRTRRKPSGKRPKGRTPGVASCQDAPRQETESLEDNLL